MKYMKNSILLFTLLSLHSYNLPMKLNFQKKTSRDEAIVRLYHIASLKRPDIENTDIPRQREDRSFTPRLYNFYNEGKIFSLPVKITETKEAMKYFDTDTWQEISRETLKSTEDHLVRSVNPYEIIGCSYVDLSHGDIRTLESPSPKSDQVLTMCDTMLPNTYKFLLFGATMDWLQLGTSNICISNTHVVSLIECPYNKNAYILISITEPYQNFVNRDDRCEGCMSPCSLDAHEVIYDPYREIYRVCAHLGQLASSESIITPQDLYVKAARKNNEYLIVCANRNNSFLEAYKLSFILPGLKKKTHNYDTYFRFKKSYDDEK